MTSSEAALNQASGSASNGVVDGAQGAPDTVNRASIDSSTMYNFREMQRRHVEFIKKRVLLLEKGLNAELQKEAFVSISKLYSCILLFMSVSILVY